MPKQKTNKAAAKRFRLTGAGKLLRRRAMKSHNLEKKSAKRKRSFRSAVVVNRADRRTVKKLLGGS